MVFEYLTTLLNALGPDKIVFGDDISIEEIDENAEVKVKTESQDKGAHVTRREVILYPSQFPREAYSHYATYIQQTKVETGAVKRIDASKDTKSLEHVDYDYIDNTIDFYDGLISENYISLLRKTLYLHEVKEHPELTLTKSIDENKRDLANEHGYEAYYVTHLVSSGYFDEGRFFRELYENLSEERGPTDEQYWDEFEKIIGEKLIAIFVSSDDTAYDLKTSIKSGVAKHYMHRPPFNFIDVCGMGYKCGLTIDQALEELSNDFDEMDYEDRDRGDERVVRIYPATIGGGPF